MKSFHADDLANSKVLSALHITYENGTQIIVIEYEIPQDPGQSSRYCRATMLVDLAAFIFEEKKFEKIKKPELRTVGSNKLPS